MLGFAFASPATRAAEPAREPRQSLALLTIGNSFANNALLYLPALAENGGKKLVWFPANLGGAGLERHAAAIRAAEERPGSAEARPYNNRSHPITGERRDFSLQEALEATKWDVVTIQQVSHQSYQPETYEPHARRVVDFVRAHAPSAEIVVHMTWAYREDHPLYQKVPGLDRTRMHERLRDAYLQLASNYGLRIIPAGEAFHAASQTPRWTFRPDPKFNYDNPPAGKDPAETGSLTPGWRWIKDQRTGEPRFDYDGFHANTAGCYLAACVWYETLFDDSVLSLTYHPRGLSAEDAADLRRLAHETVTAWRRQHAPLAAAD